MKLPAKVAVGLATFMLLSLVTAFVVHEGRGRGGGSAENAAVVHEVHIRGMRFEPAEIDARPGDTVVWINDDFLPHTATAKDASWDSGEIAPGASWKLVVEDGRAGEYLCRYHPMMTGMLSD